MNNIEKNLLKNVAPEINSNYAYNIRSNSKSIERKITDNVNIISKDDNSGIDIIVKDNTNFEYIYIPVLITESGLSDIVYNDFYIGKDCDVLIVAGCGIHNATCKTSLHSGIHSFHVGQNSKVRYVEKHVAEGKSGDKILNPITKIVLQKKN